MDMNHKLDKIAGTLKEKTGQMINSEKLELEGKIQKKRGETAEAASKFSENIKEKVSSKVNDIIDEMSPKK